MNFNINKNATQRGLKMLRQSHSNRVIRFLKGKEDSRVEDKDNLLYSKELIKTLNKMID